MSVLFASTNSLLLGHVAVGKTQNKTKLMKHCYEFLGKTFLVKSIFYQKASFFLRTNSTWHKRFLYCCYCSALLSLWREDRTLILAPITRKSLGSCSGSSHMLDYFVGKGLNPGSHECWADILLLSYSLGPWGFFVCLSVCCETVSQCSSLWPWTPYRTPYSI